MTTIKINADLTEQWENGSLGRDERCVKRSTRTKEEITELKKLSHADKAQKQPDNKPAA